MHRKVLEGLNTEIEKNKDDRIDFNLIKRLSYRGEDPSYWDYFSAPDKIMIRCSQLGYCKRYQALYALGISPGIDEAGKAFCDVGISIHRSLEENFMNNSYPEFKWVGTEISGYTKYGLKGTVDLVGESLSGVMFVADIKTVPISAGWSKQKASKREVWLHQIAGYLSINKADYGGIVTVSRAFPPNREVNWVSKEDLEGFVETNKETCKEIRQYISDGDMPPATPSLLPGDNNGGFGNLYNIDAVDEVLSAAEGE